MITIRLQDPQLRLIVQVLDDYVAQDLDETGQVLRILQDLETTRGFIREVEEV